MSFITIEKVDKEEKQYESNNGKYSLFAIIGFILAILVLFFPASTSLIISIISIIVLIIAIKDTKNNNKKGKNLVRIGLAICIIYIIVMGVLKLLTGGTGSKVSNNAIKNTVCSLTDAKGYYYSKDDDLTVLCNNFNCTVKDNKTNKVKNFDCN